jgi:hypothetical protein
LEYASRKVHEDQIRLKLNRTYQLLIYVGNVSVLGDNIDTIKKSTESLIDFGKEFSLEIKAEKTRYMLPSRHQIAGENHDIKIGNRSFESVAQFRYIGTTITNQKLVQEEIKRRLNSDNAC